MKLVERQGRWSSWHLIGPSSDPPSSRKHVIALEEHDLGNILKANDLVMY
jgi:hypothetical protein